MQLLFLVKTKTIFTFSPANWTNSITRHPLIIAFQVSGEELFKSTHVLTHPQQHASTRNSKKTKNKLQAKKKKKKKAKAK